MKAAWYEKSGPARDVLTLGEMDRPEPAAGEVLVRIHATGINPSDTKSRANPDGPAAHFARVVPHQDGAGVIEAVGDGVDPQRIGERVWVYEAALMRPFACAAQYTAVPSRNAVVLPDNVSFVEGAGLGVPALTAHNCVLGAGPVSGKTVLVTGGAGAVGFYAIQFARLHGARVITTVSRDEQAEVARKAGADFIINRKTEDVAARIGEITGAKRNRGIDLIVDVAFGANLPLTLDVLKSGGTVATYAADENPNPTLPVWALIGLHATLRFVLVYRMGEHAHDAAIAETGNLMREGKLVHHVGRTMQLDDIVAAHEALESGATVGKIVLEVD